MMFRSRLRTSRPEVTRWRVYRGVCDRDGDVITATLECQRCGSWFSVQRWPADINGRWPGFCSVTCREIHDATANRRRQRRLRAGETSGEKKPVHAGFDPSRLTIEQAVDLAQEIVDGPPGYTGWDRWASNKTYGLAADYLDAYERESQSYRS